MPIDLNNRLIELQKVGAALKKRVAANTRIMESAPAWYRPQMDINSLAPHLRLIAMRLNAIDEVIKLDRAALMAIAREIGELELDPRRYRLCYRLALQWLNRAKTADELIDAYTPDPVNRILTGGTGGAPFPPPFPLFPDFPLPTPPLPGHPPDLADLPATLRHRTLPRGMAIAILLFRNQRPNRQLKRIEDLSALNDVDDTLLRDLIYSGCRVQPTTFKPTVGILLPLRLETRFYRPETPGDDWRLRVRIIPDEAGADRHDPQPAVAELDNVERFWRRAGGDINSEKGKDAWRALVEAHGGARATWLARTFTPITDAGGNITIDRPSEVRTEPQLTRAIMPSKLELWLGRGGAPQRVMTLDVDRDALQIDLPNLEDPNERRWWHSYAEADRVGLAAEINLGPAEPNDIDAIFVVGLSSDAPDALFQAHRDAGRLALLGLGTPTNTIDGAPAADLGNDPAYWYDLVRKPATGERGTEELSAALTGEIDTLGPLPDGTQTPRAVNQTLVQALFPALWGHAFKDIYDLGDEVASAGLWAGQNLIPEGPVAPVRIGDQPYGILPVTTLGKWTAANGDPQVEEWLRASLVSLRKAWAAAAEAAGTVNNADTEKLLDLLGHNASSNDYGWRIFLSLELLHYIFWVFDHGAPYQELVEQWEEMMQEEREFSIDPRRRYTAWGWPQDLQIPLVEPTNLPDGMTFHDVLDFLAEAAPEFIARDSFLQEFFDGINPDSLLLRLLRYAKVYAAAQVTRANEKRSGSILEPIVASDKSPTRLLEDATRFDPQDTSIPEFRLYEQVRNAILTLQNFTVAEIERAFKAVLDTAIYRIDPWLTGIAWRRLQSLARKDPVYRLGAYGWVDAPRPGDAGPTDGGLLHAPSEAQAYSSIILRDKAISDPEADRWQMDLDSETIRIAARVAEQVRLGSHLKEVLGHEVERIVGDRAQIKALRRNFPIRREHAGRRVCDGQVILAADPATLGMTMDQQEALVPLRAALDVYGDLLVAEAVHQVVSGRADVAGASMDAAAGLAAPPNLDIIKTPRSGRSVGTTVAFCLPRAVDPPVAETTSPTRIADPTVAEWLVAQTGAAESASWQWTVRREDDSTVTINLAHPNLGLEPCDTSGLSSDALRQCVLAAAADGVEVLPDAPGDESHAHVRRLTDMIGSRPALPEDLVDDGSLPPATNAANELRQRLARLLQAAQLLQFSLSGVLAAGTDEQKQAAIKNAVRWGIVPGRLDSEPTLDEQLTAALEAINERAQRAPTMAAAVDLGAVDLAQAIAELATSDGHYVVFSRLELTTIPVNFEQSVRATDSDLNPVDEEWLCVVATVRDNMAKLELYQVEAMLAGQIPPLFAWSNRLSDVWQVAEPADPDTGRPDESRLIILYGPQGVLTADATNPALEVAVGLVDAWSEVIPETEQATTAAFGFNAPAARAPQAVLVAVPPDENEALTTETLVDILNETRELARARMSTPHTLRHFSGAIPSIMLPGMGETGVDLQ